MADNITVTAGSFSADVATDDVSSVHYQKMKIADGTADSSTMVPGGARGLYTVTHQESYELSAASSGLTTASTAYTAGDQVGAQFSLSNASTVSGGIVWITGVRLFDKADIIGAYEVMFAGSSMTVASDNAVFSLDDTNGELVKWVVPCAQAYDLGTCHMAQAANLALPVKLSATTLYATLRCSVGHTFFGATSDLVLYVNVSID